ncbi:alpha/beta hydrolase [Aspergillus homomorphus CBS 101889]|uniref:Alpha/beta hydrolase fold-3 domain-containing protein n=1 Tax=Aspergillus homomorphus (strain CBS 101889) TaxID=1450537 RepID=A0A395ICP6_ASPHC|nr:hypothetical protein BO97DRAFT_15279 [Aspergillus homomorphus CBS 101889]RAL17811.1 hypothetical protein BO97DRAFT_15279 [Aspergillus homomorphus CBS 101889]
MPLSLDPAYAKAVAPAIAAVASKPKSAVHDVEARRVGITGLYESIFETFPDVPSVERTVHQFRSYDGGMISIQRYAKKDTASTAPGPAIVHAHGGGMFQGSVDLYRKVFPFQVEQSNIQIFSVDYRLAPEHPHPTPLEDCYAGLLWLHEHADEFAVDRSRIAVQGESAGGNLAAGMALLARDRGLSPPLAKQVLIYPMLDDNNTVPNPALEPFATWTYDDNMTGWTAFLGQDVVGTDKVSPYAAPARATNLEGLPPTYIDVGELDIFRDEDIAFAGRIAAANISLELHVYPGLPHVFEIYAPQCEPSLRAIANRLRFLADL